MMKRFLIRTCLQFVSKLLLDVVFFMCMYCQSGKPSRGTWSPGLVQTVPDTKVANCEVQESLRRTEVMVLGGVFYVQLVRQMSQVVKG